MNKIAVDSNDPNKITTLDASFRQNCEGNLTKSLVGRVLINA